METWKDGSTVLESGVKGGAVLGIDNIQSVTMGVGS